MKTLKKSQIAAFQFDTQKTIKIETRKMDKQIVRGFIDGKRAYFLETRNVFNELLESTTFFSLSKLLKEV